MVKDCNECGAEIADKHKTAIFQKNRQFSLFKGFEIVDLGKFCNK